MYLESRIFVSFSWFLDFWRVLWYQKDQVKILGNMSKLYLGSVIFIGFSAFLDCLWHLRKPNERQSEMPVTTENLLGGLAFGFAGSTRFRCRTRLGTGARLHTQRRFHRGRFNFLIARRATSRHGHGERRILQDSESTLRIQNQRGALTDWWHMSCWSEFQIKESAFTNCSHNGQRI